MADLRTTYVGLEMECPIIVASAGITETVERMRQCQEHGAAGVVMKSWFEKEVSRHSPTVVSENSSEHVVSENSSEHHERGLVGRTAPDGVRDWAG